jgi:N-acetylglucosamine kinase-like BadF-type ATPase
LAPSTDQHKVGFDKMCEGLATAIDGALNQVVGVRSGEGHSWNRATVVAACFGLAGVDRVEDQERIGAWIRKEGITSAFKVVNDAELILEAGTPDGWGVALISGTGSVCLARSRNGLPARVGGWGHLLGDEGSGYWIAREALQLATQAADGRGDAQGLLRAILSYWRLKDAGELIAHVYRAEVKPQDISELAVPVLDLSNRGDEAARRVVDAAGKALAAHVDTVVKKLDLKKPPVAFAGSSLRATLRKVVLDSLTVEIGAVTTVQDAAQAAVAVARRLLGVAAVA